MSSEKRPPVTAEELEQLVAFYADRLELRSWSITLDLSAPPDEESSSAEIYRPYDYPVARIRVRSDWAVISADDWGEWSRPVEEIVAHELAHLALQPIDAVVRGYLLDRLSPEGSEIAGHAYGSALEGVVDQLARVLVRAYAPERCPASPRTIPPTS